MTTHSLEAIEAFLDSSEDNKEDITVFRLEKFKGNICTKRFSGENLQQIVSEGGYDIR